jgi:hypothetical protein
MVDQDRDGRMDDLNQDGRLSDADAYVLSGVIESLNYRTWYQPFIGGLGIYGADDRRGAFIHVDTRGRRARW